MNYPLLFVRPSSRLSFRSEKRRGIEKKKDDGKKNKRRWKEQKQKTEQRKKEKQAQIVSTWQTGDSRNWKYWIICIARSLAFPYTPYTIPRLRLVDTPRNKCSASADLISWQRSSESKILEISGNQYTRGGGRSVEKSCGVSQRGRGWAREKSGWGLDMEQADGCHNFRISILTGAERARYPMCKLSPCILISRCSICRRLRRRCRWRGRWRERGRRCRRCQQHPRKVCNNSLIPDDERLCGGLLPLLPFTPFQPSALQSSRVFDLELSKMHW